MTFDYYQVVIEITNETSLTPKFISELIYTISFISNDSQCNLITMNFIFKHLS